jgi:hypothetical protein
MEISLTRWINSRARRLMKGTLKASEAALSYLEDNLENF